MHIRSLLPLVALVAVNPLTAQQQTPAPSILKVRLDTPVADSGISHVAMPPGWHITTGPGTLLYEHANSAHGRYAVEAEIFLFPGESQEGYGLFVGGDAIEGNAPPSYVAFLIQRDGAASIERHGAGRTSVLFALPRADAVTAHTGQGTARNVIRVSVELDSVRFSANGSRVAALPRGDLPLEGLFGFRVGNSLNLHISQLDITRRLAPAPARRE